MTPSPSDGWETLQREAWEAPLYWQRTADGWSVFTLSGCRALDSEDRVYGRRGPFALEVRRRVLRSVV